MKKTPVSEWKWQGVSDMQKMWPNRPPIVQERAMEKILVKFIVEYEDGGTTVEDFAADNGITDIQLVRAYKEYLGLSPKEKIPPPGWYKDLMLSDEEAEEFWRKCGNG